MEELIPIVLFMSIAAVLILRPLTTRAGKLLEALAKQKMAPRTDEEEAQRTRVLLEHLAKRIDLIEERLDFTERLLSTSQRTPASSAFAAARRTDVVPRETDYVAR